MRFLIRRIARVYPLFALLTLLVGVLILTGVSHEPIPNPRQALGWNLLMLQGWGFADSIIAPAWSISTEWGAYLVFPALAAVTLFGSRRAAIAAAGAAALAIVVLATLPLGVEGPLDIYGPGSALARCIAEFSLGLIAFRVAQHAGVRTWAQRPAVGLVLGLAVIAMLLIPRSDLAVVALMPPLIVVLGVGRGPMQRLMGSPLVFLAGELSYALYLLHTRFVRVRDVLAVKLTPVLGAATPAVVSLLVYVLILAAAWVAFRFVEKPARSWVRRAERFVPPVILPDGRPAVPGETGR